jgi:murein tripeptide amidase MpaA
MSNGGNFMIIINTVFDAGSIVVHDLSNPQNLRFGIRNDTNSHFAQWFYFQLSNVKDQELSLNLEGLDKTAYPDGWDGYNVCASYDNQNWFRIESSFANNTLTWSLTPECNSIYFAYFEPYSYARHLELIGFANECDNVQHQIIGQTAEGRNLDLLVIGNPEAEYKVWITARQHPGESMAEWFMEGLIYRLCDEQDAVSINLLKNHVFYLVPNMNPDGAYHGNLRTNTTGSNLNREWLTPTLEKSPEVYYTRNKMLETSVDLFFDIHGDESLPYIFTSGCEDNPSFSAKQQKLQQQFEELFPLINPDYQTKVGYPKGHFSSESATVGTKWVGNQFDCLAYTLEMPFKDNANLPNDLYGWNGERSSLLGASLLTMLNLLKL